MRFEELAFGPSAGRRGPLGRLGFYVFLAGVAWGFVYLFSQLDRTWQIALGSVALLLGCMLLNGYRADRGTDAADQMFD